MTQHEYVFVTISIILGLAMTRLLSSVAALIRAHDRILFHWATSLWALCVMIFILQMWWVGWSLHDFTDWTILEFFLLVLAAIFLYGSAELALPVEDYDIASDAELDFLAHSTSLGRVSAASMLGYLLIGPYFNIMLFDTPALASMIAAGIGVILMLMMTLRPGWFRQLAVAFALYAAAVLFFTA